MSQEIRHRIAELSEEIREHQFKYYVLDKPTINFYHPMSSTNGAYGKDYELELQKQANELGLDFEKLAVDDRKSARDMQATTKSSIPAILAIGVTVGFFGILIGLMTDNITKSDALLLMLGSLGTAWTAIISFYFGSSASSQNKDEMIHRSTPIGN